MSQIFGIKLSNRKTNKTLYIKLVLLNDKKLITVSNENVDGTFNVLIFPSQNIEAPTKKDFITFSQLINYFNIMSEINHSIKRGQSYGDQIQYGYFISLLMLSWIDKNTFLFLCSSCKKGLITFKYFSVSIPILL